MSLTSYEATGMITVQSSLPLPVLVGAYLDLLQTELCQGKIEAAAVADL